MNKTIIFYVWYILLANIFVLIFSSCRVAIPISTPIPQASTETPSNNTTIDWNPLPTYVYYVPPSDVAGYTHFTPSEKSIIRLEFDYPSSWFFSEYVDEYGFASISLGDSRFLSLPTQAPPDQLHPTPNDFGIIDIWIVPSKPGRTVESETEDQKQSYSVSKDYKVAIDGFGARVIEYQDQIPEVNTSMMFVREIRFFVDNEIYEIRFLVAEKDRGGEFEQGYEYFFNSLKIVP